MMYLNTALAFCDKLVHVHALIGIFLNFVIAALIFVSQYRLTSIIVGEQAECTNAQQQSVHQNKIHERTGTNSVNHWACSVDRY